MIAAIVFDHSHVVTDHELRELFQMQSFVRTEKSPPPFRLKGGEAYMHMNKTPSSVL